MHGSRSWAVLGESGLSLENASYDHECMISNFETYIHYAIGVCDKKELNYALNGMYAAMIENAIGYIHSLESTRTKHRYKVPDWHYSMDDHIKIADKFLERFIKYTKSNGLKINENIILTITELVRLQFINDTVPQLEIMYQQNIKKIEELKNKLIQEKVCYFAENKENDIIFREGITNSSVTVSTVV